MLIPKITIITVCFNSARHLEETIINIINLSYPKLDYIIIDGGSDDNTTDIIKKYSSKLKYWISEPDMGIYDAMNKGWEQAESNSYILFIGCGDLIINLPEIESFQKADIIAGSVQIGNNFFFRPKTDVRLKLGNTLHHQALFIKKSLHLTSPFNLKYNTYADFDFNQRLIKKGHKIYIDPQFKSYALEGGLSAKFDSKQSLTVVRNNFGVLYMIMAKLYYYLRHEI